MLSSSIVVTALAPLEGNLGTAEDMGKALATRSNSFDNPFSGNDLAVVLRELSAADRQVVVVAYTTAGGSAATLSRALELLGADEGGETGMQTATKTIWGLLAAASFGASVYHGYRRNNSLGWGLWWGLMGGLFPVVTPAIALAQGFGKRK